MSADVVHLDGDTGSAQTSTSYVKNQIKVNAVTFDIRLYQLGA